MRIGLLGGLSIEHEGRAIEVGGGMQQAVLFRLAIDAGTSVGYRAISEDVWGLDAPENTRAALQSIVSRLRSQLPAGAIESTAGGYRLAVARSDVDALVFEDLVALATATEAPTEAQTLAARALALWAGEPWTPSDSFDWFERDLRSDHKRAVDLAGPSGAARGSRPARSNIPSPLTPLLGRERELTAVRDQLEANRLVTVIGTGGAGKTRVAIETAASRKAAVLVELAPVGAGEVIAAIQAATGRDIRTAEPANEATGSRDRVLEALFGRDVLLVLDNCEHVIDAAARIAEDLLTALPQLRILATSREPLGVPGEAFVNIGALGHPPEREIERLEPAALGEFAAVQLLCQRALAARGSALTDDEVRTAARICVRLDGLPLAIELAAAKLRTMSPVEVLDGLDRRFTLLTGGFRTALPRHQTLRAMIDWSWSLLSADERLVLARIAVFPAGIDVAAADELAASMGLPSSGAFESLVDRSLLQRSRGRYRALETIREYGVDRLAESGEIAEAREAQAVFIAAGAQRHDRLLRGPQINDAIAWFDAEDDNIAAAIRFAIGMPLPDTAVGLVVSCAWYWIIRDRGDDARVWFASVALIAHDAHGDEARALSMIAPVVNAFSEPNVVAAPPSEVMTMISDLLEPMLGLELASGSHEVLQLLKPALGAFRQVAGAPDWMSRMVPPDGAALGLDPWPTAVLHIIAAAMYHNRGEIELLGRETELAVEQFTSIGDLWGLAVAQQLRGEWLVLQGQLDEALRLSDESTENMRRITSSWDLAQQQGLAVSILMRTGRMDEARRRVDQMVIDADAAANVRTQLQAHLTAILVDIQEHDAAAAGSRLTIIDELFVGWPGMPPQLDALIESTRACVFLLLHDLESAERHLRLAALGAIESHDQPIMGMVAVVIGSFEVERGRFAAALRAVDLAAALVGARDATNPQIIAIEEAAQRNGVRRSSDDPLPRPLALEELKSILD